MKKFLVILVILFGIVLVGCSKENIIKNSNIENTSTGDSRAEYDTGREDFNL